MAITRRQFVTRLGTLGAAMGISQVDLAKVAQVFAHGSVWAGQPWTTKPKVVWVHGAECTGCSTSLLSFFEDVRGKAVEGTNISTLAALDLAVGGDGDGSNVLTPDANHPFAHRTLVNTDGVAGCNFEKASGGDADGAYVATIADVLIDFIALEYHETVMGMGGDLAYKWLDQLIKDTAGNSQPFVLVVEGAIQPKEGGGYWNKTGAAPWCSIGMSEADDGHGQPVGELSFDDVVAGLASHSKCKVIIPIGQCATFGGYPAAVSPVLGSGQTGAKGTFKFLDDHSAGPIKDAAQKVVNVPGCPTNPWWFILTVVAWLVDFTQPSRPLGVLKADGSLNPAAIDDSRRLKAVYGQPLHGPYCKRYQYFLDGVFAAKPGDPGCLQLIGCKGPSTMTLCGVHGWNAQHPRSYAADPDLDYGVGGINREASGANSGGNCVVAGHPCMGCTEQGYPDKMLPFVVR